MLYNFAADSFYIMKLCSRLFVLHCRSRPKYETSMHFDPHFEEVELELLFLSLTVEALQAKTCQNSQPSASGVGRSL